MLARDFPKGAEYRVLQGMFDTSGDIAPLNLIGIAGGGGNQVSGFITGILAAAGRKPGLVSSSEAADLSGLKAALDGMPAKGITDVVLEVPQALLYSSTVCRFGLHIAVLTGPQHEEPGGYNAVEDGKCSTARLIGMCRHAVINADVPAVCHAAKEAGCDTILTFGIKAAADIRAEDIEYASDGIRFALSFMGLRKIISIKAPGKSSVYDALAAIGACCLSGVSLIRTVRGLESIEREAGDYREGLECKTAI